MQHHAEYGHFCWIHQKQRIDDWRTECEMATKVPALSSHSPASPQGCGTGVAEEGTVTGTTESVTCPPAQFSDTMPFLSSILQEAIPFL